MAAAPGSAAVAELIGANGGRWVSSAGGAFAVQGGNVVDMRDGSVIATLRPAVGAPSMLMQNVAVEVRNVPYFGEITDYRPAWVVDAARSSERQVTWVGERTHREIDPPDEITWTPLVRALPAPAPPTHPALTPRLAARAVGSVRRRDHRAIAPPPSRPLHPPISFFRCHARAPLFPQWTPPPPPPPIRRHLEPISSTAPLLPH